MSAHAFVCRRSDLKVLTGIRQNTVIRNPRQMSYLAGSRGDGTWVAHDGTEAKSTMEVPTGVSRPTRGLSGTDVMFLVSLAFVFFALVVTIAVVHR